VALQRRFAVRERRPLPQEVQRSHGRARRHQVRVSSGGVEVVPVLPGDGFPGAPTRKER
jgi:hypothetical protein